jgi:hypothetical protein
MPADLLATSATSAAQEQRIAQLRRAFQKQLRRKPTVIEKAAMERAIRLTVRAEQVALDQSVPVDLPLRSNDETSEQAHTGER